jgi:hypothetical protein
MKNSIKQFLNSSTQFIKIHSPEILTGIGIVGFGTSIYYAIKATPKAMTLIEEKKKKLNLQKDEKLTKIETIKTVWKPYVPTIGISIASAACIIGASKVNYKRNAALATAYSLTEKSFNKYKEKVIETIGENKEKNICNKISQDEINNQKCTQVIITSNGNTLCRDSISSRYFKSDIETIKQIVNKLNRRINTENYVSLNDYYNEIGLPNNDFGDLLGWNIDKGLIEPIFDACLAEDGQPCINIKFDVEPIFDYDKYL